MTAVCQARNESIYDLEAEIDVNEFTDPRYQKEFQFQIQGIPIDIVVTNTFAAGYVSFGMRVGIGFVAGVTEMSTEWQCCVFKTDADTAPAFVDFTWSQTFTRPVVRQACATDKWSRWKMNKNAFLTSELEARADPQGRLKIHWLAKKFESHPDNSVLLRLMFDQLFRTADQNVILKQTNALRDALEMLTSVRRRNEELDLKVKQLTKQSKVDQQTIRTLQESSNVLSSKKRKASDTPECPSGIPKCTSQLETILFAMQESVINKLDRVELRSMSNTVFKFQNAVSQVLASGKTCNVCLEEISEAACIVSCGHTGTCLQCALTIVAQHETGKAPCPQCRQAISSVIKTF